MALGREAIYSALYNLLSGKLLAPAGPFVTVSRRLQDAASLTDSAQPALFLNEIGERYEDPLLGGPPKVTLLAQLFIYAMCDYQSDTPATDINNLMDSIEDAMTPLPALGVLTLGDLVQHAWIEGRITDYVTMAQGRQSVSVIEVAMLATH